MGEPADSNRDASHVPPEDLDKFGAWEPIGTHLIPGEYEPHHEPERPPVERSRDERPSDKRA